ncbi:MAG: tetratricopeptide repeat protein [Cardiobacteriaceae bacterium]|nr:tetratricopeptide repeat protein [Cardiobacteriaceae bacterium]
MQKTSEDKILLDNAVVQYQAKSYQAALPLFEQASARGSMKAPRYLGLMYLNGEGVKRNPQRAFAEFQKAAVAGDITGQYWLGHLYEQGIGTEKNTQQAIHWYTQSARVNRIDHITAPAMNALGRCYENGIGVPVDRAQALAWYKKVAEGGSIEAQESVKRLEEP